jgi:hypothetical protein
MTERAADDCRVCEMTLAEYCATGSPTPTLCGLCHLIPHDRLKRYFETWANSSAARYHERFDEHDRS